MIAEVDLYIDTKNEEQDVEYMDLMIKELDSSTERELGNIAKEMGADLIPLLISRSYEEHLKRLLSTKRINLERMNNIHRLFRFIICQLQKDYSCEERKLTLFFLASIADLESSKMLIVTYPGLLESFNIANPHENEMLFTTQILNELSKDYDGKHFMGQTLPVLNILKSALEESSTDDEHPYDHETYINAMETLKHLSEAAENQMMILSLDSGRLFNRVISIAQDYKQLESSILALQIINNLISRSTIDTILSCSTLLETLSALAIVDFPLEDVSLQAAHTMEKISLFIRPGNNNLPATFLNHLMKFTHDLEKSQNSACLLRLIAFECLKKLAITKENRLMMAKTSAFINYVCKALASYETNQQSFATTIVYEMSRCRQAARVLSQSGVLIGSLLSIVIQSQNINDMSIRRQAIKSILTMINDDRAALSIFQKDILSDLAAFVARSDDDDDNELKRNSLKAVIRLTNWL